MKKKVRKIVVADKEYAWLVSPIDQNYVRLKVWHADAKSIPWFQVHYRFDDPWLNFPEIAGTDSKDVDNHFQLKPIQPKHVAKFIADVAEYASKATKQKIRTLNFKCGDEGELTMISIDQALT